MNHHEWLWVPSRPSFDYVYVVDTNMHGRLYDCAGEPWVPPDVWMQLQDCSAEACAAAAAAAAAEARAAAAGAPATHAGDSAGEIGPAVIDGM
jgi:hypothetical protein